MQNGKNKTKQNKKKKTSIILPEEWTQKWSAMNID